MFPCLRRDSKHVGLLILEDEGDWAMVGTLNCDSSRAVVGDVEIGEVAAVVADYTVQMRKLLWALEEHFD